MNKKLYIYWILGITIFCIDRFTKWCALLWCIDAVDTHIPFLSFEVVVNRGISWGIFHSSSGYAFVAVSLIIGIVTGIVLLHAIHSVCQGLPIIGQVCIVAGSLSNMVDRIYYSGVIDFIVLSYNQLSWPVFNFADMAIVIGVGIMMLQQDTGL